MKRLIARLGGWFIGFGVAGAIVGMVGHAVAGTEASAALAALGFFFVFVALLAAGEAR